jgi:hypothetical protein
MASTHVHAIDRAIVIDPPRRSFMLLFHVQLSRGAILAMSRDGEEFCPEFIRRRPRSSGPGVSPEVTGTATARQTITGAASAMRVLVSILLRASAAAGSPLVDADVDATRSSTQAQVRVALPDSVPKGGAACASDLDCSLAGTCSGGRCDCDAAWTGPTCEQLHLLPAHRSAFDPAGGHPTQLPSDRPFTWGGSIIKDDAGLYHLFVVEYMNHCPMTYGTWTVQSSVRHAVSRSASGPWEPKELPLGPGPTGNPVVTRAPDGTYLLYFTNVPRQNRTAAEPPPRNCSSNQRSDWGPVRYCTEQCETGLHLAHSKSLDGPWTVVLGITKAGGTNPGVLILKSGKVILFYKGSATFPFNSTLCPAGRCRSIGLVTAPAWDSFPYSDFLTTVRKNSTLNTAFRRQFHLKTSI